MMTVFILQFRYIGWDVDRWDVAGISQSFEGAKAIAEHSDNASVDWQKQLTYRGSGEWWQAVAADKNDGYWRIIQMELNP